MSLPVNGKVIVETTVGDIEIELWAKETPKACRNFLALAMEGYYDGVIFHRVVPNFLVQTGDRTGTGFGGESFYGDTFEDEIHPRLRFAHRGLVAMANNGTKNSNDSQFFITLDRADELHGKHTLFGRTVGDTIFNVLKIGQLELGDNERPLYPPKIKTIRIVENPFDDIVPRITAAEKRAQQLAKESSQRQREEAIRKKGAKKNVALLSFGDNAEAEDEPVVFTKKSLNRPDLIDNPTAAASFSAINVPEPPKAREKAKATEDAAKPTNAAEGEESKPSEAPERDLTSIRKKHKSDKEAKKNSQKTELEKMEDAVRKLARRHSDSESDDERDAKKQKGPSQLELELAKYKKGRSTSKKGKGKGRDEGDVLAALSSFRGRLQKSLGDDDDEDVGMQDATGGEGDNEGQDGQNEETAKEVDDDSSWIGHRLKFAKDDGSETRRAEHEYEVIDPRARGNQAKLEERERKASKRAAVGKAFEKGKRW
ncbi:cyclophilin-like protein [Ceratobasidium sp. AG-I]|nr:cyclophilin-like protein [Ceratobasidium sp. AG-I]